MVRRRVVVSGRVQGVFYRDSCKREAVAAGLAGWVRNRADGTVEAVLEGEQEGVERVVRWMRSGPSHAEVDDVTVVVEQPTGERGFSIR